MIEWNRHHALHIEGDIKQRIKSGDEVYRFREISISSAHQDYRWRPIGSSQTNLRLTALYTIVRAWRRQLVPISRGNIYSQAAGRADCHERDDSLNRAKIEHETVTAEKTSCLTLMNASHCKYYSPMTAMVGDRARAYYPARALKNREIKYGENIDWWAMSEWEANEWLYRYGECNRAAYADAYRRGNIEALYLATSAIISEERVASLKSHDFISRNRWYGSATIALDELSSYRFRWTS